MSARIREVHEVNQFIKFECYIKGHARQPLKFNSYNIIENTLRKEVRVKAEKR
jgi:hypothetical protein